MQAKIPKKILGSQERRKKNLVEGDLTFKVKCQGIIIKKYIKCFNDSKFNPECSKKTFLRS